MKDPCARTPIPDPLGPFCDDPPPDQSDTAKTGRGLDDAEEKKTPQGKQPG